MSDDSAEGEKLAVPMADMVRLVAAAKAIETSRNERLDMERAEVADAAAAIKKNADVICDSEEGRGDG